jgi:hypothetical protein
MLKHVARWRLFTRVGNYSEGSFTTGAGVNYDGIENVENGVAADFGEESRRFDGLTPLAARQLDRNRGQSGESRESTCEK